MRRGFATLLLLLLYCATWARDTAAVHLERLPFDGMLLNKGWKYTTGDDLNYARPDYDDSKWQAIDPTVDIQELPQLKQGIGWLRLPFSIDSDLLNKPLLLAIEQAGASQIYLNGNLIHTIGVFDTDRLKIKAYDPEGGPVLLPVKNAGRQLLAIRYGLQPGVRYNVIYETFNYAFKARINTLDAFNQRNQQLMFFVRGPSFLINGVFFILAVLHLSLFLFDPSQKANFYFGLFALTTLVGFLYFFSYIYAAWIEHKFFILNLSADLIFTGGLLMFTAIYQLLEQKKNWWFYTIVLLNFLCMISFMLPGYWAWTVGSVITSNLINIEIIRISILAVKKKKRGAWIIAVGCAFYVLCWTVFLFARNRADFNAVGGICYYLAFLSIPVATSIFLGLESAVTNKLLQRKLLEVHTLSQKTLAQEKEKQQLLAMQNELLEQKVTERTTALNNSLQELKATQAQLIQSEKMASLGELTAGIAHEIQNPLNFVNNFSEINTELIADIKNELSSGNLEEAKELLHDLEDNESKINHHGRRADSIVKGMLQHSRTSSSQKEPTDINKLADEYLRLSYHGLRAKDKSFNAKIKTDFDETIGTVSVVPQDMGRVLLNLFNNAFYAVHEHLKKLGSESYEPTVTVSTKKLADKVEIIVQDNGMGISKSLQDKIFQPFFTTKPTGQGTGLGLSLSYDIVKGHGGKLKVESKEGNGTTFTVQLFYSNSTG